jgi:uridine kinase
MIIGICGGTGSGKTTVANRILESVRADEVVFIQQDLYYRDLKDMPLDYRNAANFDHPDALDNDLLVNHLKKLTAGESVELPIYDFKTHTRLPATTRVEPKPIVIVEGILIFACLQYSQMICRQVPHGGVSCSVSTTTTRSVKSRSQSDKAFQIATRSAHTVRP